MNYEDINGETQFMELDEVYTILCDYCCTGSPDLDYTHATFGHTMSKFDGAMEIARILVADRIEAEGGKRPQ